MNNFPYASEKELLEGEKLFEEISTKLETNSEKQFSKLEIIKSVLRQLKKNPKAFFRISLPIVLVAPISLLELLALYYTPSISLVNIGKVKDPEERFIRVLKSQLLNIPRIISPSTFMHCKPFNPILGEVHACKWKHSDQSETLLLAEQVSHHPPISSVFILNKKNNFTCSTTLSPKTTINGPNSVAFHMDGELNFCLNELNEEYKLSFPKTIAGGVIMGKQYLEYNGEYKINCPKTGISGVIAFREKSNNQLAGRIMKGETILYKISGHADGLILIKAMKTKKVSVFVDNGKKDFLKIKPICRKLIFQEENESRRNWFKVTEYLKKVDIQKAEEYKIGIENKERWKRKERREKNIVFQPKYFKKIKKEKETDSDETLFKCIFEDEVKNCKGETKTKFEKLSFFKE